VRALGIETATPIASAAVVDGDGILAERTLRAPGSHAQTLLQLADDVLSAAAVPLDSLDLLAVSIGPGSFTGLRIGLSVAKGLALARGLAVVGVPTLEAYARAAGRRPGAICPVLDARKGEVYAAAFGWHGDALLQRAAPRATAPEQFAETLSGPCTLLGDGVDAYFDRWRAALGDRATLIRFADLAPSAVIVARLGIARAAAVGGDDLADLEPEYCRVSEAERRHLRGADGASLGGGGVGVEKLTGGRG
jgi:tRNA threonylcarbamoyladenosine biosynthesis protein TsaB